MKKTVTAIFVLLSTLSWSQNSRVNWMFNPFDEKVFVENAGQLTVLEKELSCTILFSFEQGNTDFFLCTDQFNVRESKDKLIQHDEKDDPAEEMTRERQYSYFRFSFTGCGTAHITGEKKSGALNKFY